MTRIFLGAAIGFFLAGIALTGVARAETTLPANKSVMIYDFAVWHPSTCAHFGKPKYRVRTEPKHGKLHFVHGVSKSDNLPSHCKGKVKGLQVIYTPDRGYRGPDSFVLTVLQPRFVGDPAPRGSTVRPKFTVK